MTMKVSEQHHHLIDIPAADSGAVFAHAEAAVIGEHRLRLRALLEREVAIDQLDEQLEQVHAESQKSLGRHVARLHSIVSSRALTVATDLDAARLNPARVSTVSAHQWMLGYCAGCASIETTRQLALVIAPTIDQRMRYELAAISTAHEQAQLRWNACVDRMLSSRPWIRREGVLFELIDITTPAPKFRVSIQGAGR